MVTDETKKFGGKHARAYIEVENIHGAHLKLMQYYKSNVKPYKNNFLERPFSLDKKVYQI